MRDSVQVFLIAAALGAVPVAVAGDSSDISQLVRARYVHCAFYKSYETDPATGGPIMVEGRSNSLMYFQRIDVEHETADAISTRMSGRRSVTVKKTAKAIHFIDNVDGMYVMTSVHSCLDFDEKHGVCLTYGAINARVFDSTVLADPDKVYDRIKDIADPGFCDHSFIGIQEASHSDR
jgi:hypothetical protein